MSNTPRLMVCGDRSLLVYLGDRVDPGINRRVHALARALARAPHPAVVEVTPGYHAVLIEYDPLRIRMEQLEELVHAALKQPDTVEDEQTVTEIPVLYGGDAGPDLSEVAARAGLSAAEAISRHAQATYRVYCLGFAPGFPYLGGLDPALATPRLAEPRTRVPAGSVAIGGNQTGIYPVVSPGGWRLIGRTPARLFDPAQARPALVEPGTSLRFVPINQKRFAALTAGADPAAPARPPVEGRTGLRIVQPGLMTTVQDLGRRGFMRYGVPVAGAADFRSLMVGNWLLGNRARTAALEITLSGPEVEFTGPVAFCLTGAPIPAELIPADGGSPQPVPGWTALLASPGDRLRIGTAEAGCRAYLCMAGGIDLPPVLGSLSEDLFGKLGPFGRPLQTGDWLPTGLPLHPPADLAGRSVPLDALPPFGGEVVIRAMRGPQAAAFAADRIAAFFAGEYTVGPNSDRQGIRLQGAPILPESGTDILSEPIPPGVVQVPSNGQPILLLSNRQTMGGYAKIACAVYPDVAAAAQLRPGDTVRFTEVDFAEAHAIAWAERRRLAQVRRWLEREISTRNEAMPPRPTELVRAETVSPPAAAPADAQLSAQDPQPQVQAQRIRTFRVTISDITFEATVEEIPE